MDNSFNYNYKKKEKEKQLNKAIASQMKIQILNF